MKLDKTNLVLRDVLRRETIEGDVQRTKITKMQISKFSGPDVSILAGPFSKAE